MHCHRFLVPPLLPDLFLHCHRSLVPTLATRFFFLEYTGYILHTEYSSLIILLHRSLFFWVCVCVMEFSIPHDVGGHTGLTVTVGGE